MKTNKSYIASLKKVLKSLTLKTGLVFILQGITAIPLEAHIFWVEPDNFHPKVGEPIQITLRVGDPFEGDTRPYIPAWFTKFIIAAPAGQTPVTGEMGDDPAGRVQAKAPGVHIIAFHGTRALVNLKPEKFHNYLWQWGLERIIEARKEAGELEKPVNEAYSRCAKALLNVDSQMAKGGFGQNLGCTLELISENNPYQMTAGDTMRFRLLYEGQPVEGALIVGVNKNQLQKSISVRTDDQGRASLMLPWSGEWLFNTIHMVRVSFNRSSSDENAIHWHSYWASMIFDLP